MSLVCSHLFEFESFDQILNFLFRNGLNLSKIGNPLKSESLDLNFISEPKSIFDF
jgi:hypothetical protein